jgi:hypothetical protein
MGRIWCWNDSLLWSPEVQIQVCESDSRMTGSAWLTLDTSQHFTYKLPPHVNKGAFL